MLLASTVLFCTHIVAVCFANYMTCIECFFFLYKEADDLECDSDFLCMFCSLWGADHFECDSDLHCVRFWPAIQELITRVSGWLVVWFWPPLCVLPAIQELMTSSVILTPAFDHYTGTDDLECDSDLRCVFWPLYRNWWLWVWFIPHTGCVFAGIQ